LGKVIENATCCCGSCECCVGAVPQSIAVTLSGITSVSPGQQIAGWFYCDDCSALNSTFCMKLVQSDPSCIYNLVAPGPCDSFVWGLSFSQPAEPTECRVGWGGQFDNHTFFISEVNVTDHRITHTQTDPDGIDCILDMQGESFPQGGESIVWTPWDGPSGDIPTPCDFTNATGTWTAYEDLGCV